MFSQRNNTYLTLSIVFEVYLMCTNLQIEMILSIFIFLEGNNHTITPRLSSTPKFLLELGVNVNQSPFVSESGNLDLLFSPNERSCLSWPDTNNCNYGLLCC